MGSGGAGCICILLGEVGEVGGGKGVFKGRGMNFTS